MRQWPISVPKTFRKVRLGETVGAQRVYRVIKENNKFYDVYDLKQGFCYPNYASVWWYVKKTK